MSKLAIDKDNCSLKVGDLGNVSAGEDGRASFRLTDRLIKVIPSMEGKKGGRQYSSAMLLILPLPVWNPDPESGVGRDWKIGGSFFKPRWPWTGFSSNQRNVRLHHINYYLLITISISYTSFFTRDGNCGTGVACGIIARSAGLGENTKKICACDGVSAMVIWWWRWVWLQDYLSGDNLGWEK